MQENVDAIRQALLFFPAIALLFTLPYLAYNYRKFGSVFSLRILVVYSFVLYLLCVYCLVILPLPTREAAAALHGHKAQLKLFHFVQDIVKHSCFVWNEPRTWLSLVNNPAFLTNLLNVLMTLPFGIYLKYYFRCGWKKTMAAAFLLSLFFELTQLTGLYFIYPGSYRLFDVDDLLMNTLGAMLGFALARPLTRWLPTREELDRGSFARSRHVSLLRRMLATFYDLLVCAIAGLALAAARVPLALWGVPVYLVLCPWLMKGQTIGLKWTNLALRRTNGALPGWRQYLIRGGCLFLVFGALPVAVNLLLVRLWYWKLLSPLTMLVLLGAFNGGYLFALLFEALRMAVHKPLFYERLSGTRLVSTLQTEDADGAEMALLPDVEEK